MADASTVLAAARYEIHSRLGVGGLGTVYRAFDRQLQRWVAVKRLKPDSTVSPDQLHQEATILAALQHPNIVTVFDCNTDDQGAFVVMELIEGETLEQFIARGVLSADQFRELARQALEGLHAAHQLRLIHCDLKPGNLMLTWLPSGSFQLKILDFGLARFAAVPRATSLDHSGSLYGSIYFMAPELFSQQPADSRSDLYAMGGILYFALTGQHPFEGDSIAGVMAAHLQHRVVPLEQLRPDLPRPLTDWVMSLIELDPKARPMGADVALARLHQLPARATAAAPAPRSPLTGLWVTVGCLLLAGLVIAGWQLTAGRQSPAPAPTPPAASAPPASGTEFDPTDVTNLRPLIGQNVTLRGTPIRVGESRTGAARYLNFHEDYRQAVSLVFFPAENAAFTLDSLRAYVGRPVRVAGRLEEHNGNLQIKVRTLEDLRTP
jgi:serine/threonine protein kinase